MDALEYGRWLAQQPEEVREQHNRAAIARMKATQGGYFALPPEEQALRRAEADQAEIQADRLYGRDLV